MELVNEENSNFVLSVEVWEERMPVFPLKCGCNRLLGRVTIDLKPILSNPFRPVEDWYIFQEHTNPNVDGQVAVNLLYEAGRHGMLVATLIEGKSLRPKGGLINWLLSDKMDPYVQLEFGGQTVRSKTCNDGHTAPSFFNEQLLLWSGTLPGKRSRLEEAWMKPMAITVFDNDLGRDYVVGKTTLDILQFFSVEQVDSNKMRSIELKKRIGAESGELIYR